MSTVNPYDLEKQIAVLPGIRSIGIEFQGQFVIYFHTRKEDTSTDLINKIDQIMLGSGITYRYSYKGDLDNPIYANDPFVPGSKNPVNNDSQIGI
jgi:hypothetical protein